MRKILLIPGAMAILSMPLMSLSACSKQSEPEQPFDAEHCLRFTTRSDEAHLSLKDSTHGEVQVIVPDLYYSFDEGLTKHKYNFSSNNRENIVIPKNSSIIFWGNNPQGFSKSISYDDYYSFYFKMSDNVNVSVSGNVMSLIDNGKCLQTEMPCDGCFNCLFYNTYISSAENLILPSHMTARCFEQMFCYCYYLIAAPTLPATTLAEMCYYRMFDGCHRLKIIQKIPSNSEKLIFKCIIHESTEFAVYHMFYGCFGEEGYFTGTPSNNNSYFWEE